MSLAWPEPVIDIYLGRRLALVGRGAQASIQLPYAPTMPLERVLAMLHHSAAALLQPGRPLRLRLGAAFCPPVAFAVPPHLTRWRELHAWAQQCAAQALDTDPARLLVDGDRLHHGLAAALPRAVQGALQAWAVSHRLAIRSLGPLWSEATRCGQARRAHALCVLEPDGWVRLPPSGHPSSQAASQAASQSSVAAVSAFEPADPGAAEQTPLPTLIDAHPGGASATALAFRPDAAATRCAKGPSFLAMHWEALRAP